MIDEKRLIKECEERLLVGTNVIKLIEEQPKICEWIPLEEKTPENGEHVLLSFANEKQNPLVGTWKVDDEGGAFYAPFTGRTYASLTGLLGANCYHMYYPFFPGISVRNYTDEWLDEQNKKDNTPKSFDGKEYTAYEARQKQRKMETAMRAQRQKVKLMESGGADKDEVMLHKAKYQAQLGEYARFSKRMGLKQQRERIYLGMRGRVALRSLKAVKQFPPEMIQNAGRDIAQYRRYKNVLGKSIGSLVEFGRMKYNDDKKWKDRKEAYTDVNWQRKALVNRTKGTVHSVPYMGTPNSVFDNYKDGVIQSRRYYGKDGKPKLDIDMSDHGNAKEHPVVPHYHNWYLTDKGTLKRESKHDNTLKLGHKIANSDILSEVMKDD